MRRVVVQCRKPEDIPKLMSIIEEFKVHLVKPSNPERFDNIHLDVPEDTATYVEEFKRKLMEDIPLIAVQIF